MFAAGRSNKVTCVCVCVSAVSGWNGGIGVGKLGEREREMEGV